jgi:hypothetical protein
MKTYFTNDGTYGSANDDEDIFIVDTSNFTDDDWDDIEECPDATRMALAKEIAKEKSK